VIETDVARSSARPLQAQIDIAAPPPSVWRVVSDLRRTPQWSPQCRQVLPLGAVRAGCWLVGFNRRGAVRWVTLARVVQYLPEQEISWRVNTNRSIWTYRIEATDDGSRLVETRQTPHGINPFARWFTARFLNGQASLDNELEAGMARGLQQIKTVAERECQLSPGQEEPDPDANAALSAGFRLFSKDGSPSPYKAITWRRIGNDELPLDCV
jgi:uncharacterized protein YndB with AHSA1/START domain